MIHTKAGWKNSSFGPISTSQTTYPNKKVGPKMYIYAEQMENVFFLSLSCVCLSLFLALFAFHPLSAHVPNTCKRFSSYEYKHNMPYTCEASAYNYTGKSRKIQKDFFDACLSENLPTDKSNSVDRAEKPWKLFMILAFFLCFLADFARNALKFVWSCNFLNVGMKIKFSEFWF